MLKKILPAFLLCFWVSQSFSQLIIENNLTVEQYVQDVLLGQNVTVMNIEYNSGSPNVVVPAVGGAVPKVELLSVTSEEPELAKL